MKNKLKNDLIFIITAFIIGYLFITGNELPSLLSWIEVLLVLAFALRKAINLILSSLFVDRNEDLRKKSKVSHISVKY